MEKKIRLVIWDADETLWDGSVYYIDKRAVRIKPGTEATLKELKKRGIISTLCSKNNYEDVDSMLKKFNIDKYIEKPQIGWELKSKAIRKLIRFFNLSLEEIVFVDDDSFQRAEVLSQFPELNVIELADPIDILDIDGIKQEADQKRVRILKEARDREVAEKDNRSNYEDFLRRCDIRMTVREIEKDDWPRVVQLFNRTNELNATGNRYQLKELKKLHETNDDRILVAELTDKFGDYGLIAETIINTKLDVWFIHDLTVSCRTMGRGIGGALVLTILNLAKRNKIKRVRGYVKPTESNWRMQPLFEKRGFRKTSDDGKIKRYEFDLNDRIKPYPDWLNITIKI